MRTTSDISEHLHPDVRAEVDRQQSGFERKKLQAAEREAIAREIEIRRRAALARATAAGDAAGLRVLLGLAGLAGVTVLTAYTLL